MVRIIESFSSIKTPLTLKEGELHTLPSGLIIELLPIDPHIKKKQENLPNDPYVKKDQERLRMPSGFREASGRNPGNEEERKRFGKTELVVGDAAYVKVTLPKKSIQLGIVYYQLLDYTLDDTRTTGRRIDQLTHNEKCFGLEFFYNAQALYSGLQAYPAFDQIRDTIYDNSTCTHLVLKNLLIGTLHIGQISWIELP